MAIYRCEECDNLIDGDYDPAIEYGDGSICESCAEYLICESCDKQVEEGDLHEGNCVECNYEAKREAEDVAADNEYDRRKDERMSREYEQEQKDTARTLGEGE